MVTRTWQLSAFVGLVVSQVCGQEAPSSPISHGDLVYLRQPDHGTYLGLCGASSWCGSTHKALGFDTRANRTKWFIEEKTGFIYLRQPDHGTYLGMCGHARHCGGSSYGVRGYSKKLGRTQWTMEMEGDYIYLRQPAHGAYLGMCGNDNGCEDSKHGILGYGSKPSRTRWIVESVEPTLPPTPSPTPSPTPVPPTPAPTPRPPPVCSAGICSNGTWHFMISVDSETECMFACYKGQREMGNRIAGCSNYSYSNSTGLCVLFTDCNEVGRGSLPEPPPLYIENSSAYKTCTIPPLPPPGPVPQLEGLILDFRAVDYVAGSNEWQSRDVDGENVLVAKVHGDKVTYDEGEVALVLTHRIAIEVPLATNPLALPDVTYSGWFKPTQTGGFGWVLAQYPDYGWSRGLSMLDSRLGGIGLSPGFHNSGLGHAVLGEWVHLAGVYNGRGTCVAYKNGARGRPMTRCGNGQRSNTAQYEKLIIGGRGVTDGHHNSNVMVSDVMVFNRALDDEEIVEIYNKGVRPSLA